MGKAEQVVEQYLKTQCQKRKWLCWKFSSPSLRGVPDRIIIAPGLVAFVECKSAVGRLRPQQKKRLAELADRDIPAFVVYTKDEVDNLLHTLEKRLS